MNRSTELSPLPTASQLVGRFFYAVVASYLIFAHGCHGGDEDHELSLLPILTQPPEDGNPPVDLD